MNEVIKSPQDNIEAYLCNSINIEIYKELTKIDALEFFNKLYYEFDFFEQNIKNYLKIINHFEGFNSLEEHNKLKDYPFLENYVFYFYESLNKLITKHYPVESREDRIIKSCEHIEEIYKRLSISVYGTYSQFESFLEEIEDFEDEVKIKSLIEFKYLSLKNPQIFISNQGIPFHEKCELEIRRLKELLKLESETFISLPTEPAPENEQNKVYFKVGLLFAKKEIYKNVVTIEGYKKVNYYFKDEVFDNPNQLSKRLSLSRQYINDSFTGAKTKHNIFNNLKQLNNIIEYCNKNEIIIDVEFLNKYSVLLENRH